MAYIIAPDKRGINKIFFLFLHENIGCGYSLEVSRRDTSNEYPQHMFLWRNKKNYQNILVKKRTYLVLWHTVSDYIASLAALNTDVVMSERHIFLDRTHM